MSPYAFTIAGLVRISTPKTNGQIHSSRFGAFVDKAPKRRSKTFLQQFLENDSPNTPPGWCQSSDAVPISRPTSISLPCWSAMMPQEQGEHLTTINNLAYLSIWEEGESSDPLVEQSNSSLNSSAHSSISHKSLPQSPPISPTPGTRRKLSKSDYQLKNARDALVGSISAVINFLGIAGVPKPSCEQLQRNLALGRYFAVLKRVQDYIQCIHSNSEDDMLAKIHLAVTAWEALCRLKNIEYKRAYKHCFHIRYELKGSPLEIKQAIAMQVKLAEQCTACHKKLYLVQRWQRHLLNQMKRSTMIEPQGYQPIRCL